MKSRKHIDIYKTIRYYNDQGVLHKLSGPSRLWPDGDKFWEVKHQYHRIYGPSYEWNDGNKEWWVNDAFINHFKEVSS